MLKDFLKKGLTGNSAPLFKGSSDYKKHLYALILAGGGGTRLWPKSRNRTPKQFLKLFKNKTLMQITAERINKFLPWERIFVTTVSDVFKREILREVRKVLPRNVFVEPVRRDSAPAHGLGAAYVYKRDPNAVIINAAVDHFISTAKQYEKTMMAAAAAAYSGDWLVAIGIKPSYPHTGMGHIKKGKKLQVVEGRAVYKLLKFEEKPPLPMAERYTKSGKYLWNANQYVWRADTFLKALKLHAPEIGEGIERISKAIGTTRENATIKEEFEKMHKISVDYAVSEKAKNFLMLVAPYSWTDIGDWKEVWENLPKDKFNNVIIDGEEPGGKVINLGTSNTLVHTDGRLIAIIDVDDIVIVDTKDALLVCKRTLAQSVKKIVEKLKAEGSGQYL